MSKYAFVTGGSRGIGRAVCVKLAQMGFCVVINYVSNDEAAQETLRLVQEVGGSGELLKFDVADTDASVKAITGWQESHPDNYVEVLVNNAGVRKDNLLLWLEPEDWFKVVSTDLNSFYNVTRPFLQPMVSHRNGRIINMASLSGLKGLPGQTNYSAAKGGLIAATKALAQELAPRKITVNAVAPGFVETDMVEGLDEASLKAQIPARRRKSPPSSVSLHLLTPPTSPVRSSPSTEDSTNLDVGLVAIGF